MSDQQKWSEMGKKTQDFATAQALRKAKEAEEKHSEALRLQKQKAEAKAATYKVLAQVLSVCESNVDAYNSSIKDQDWKMSVTDRSISGPGVISFAVRKETGFPRIAVSIEQDCDILVALFQEKGSGRGKRQVYTVSGDGRISVSNTSAINAADIAENICSNLHEAITA